MACSTRPAVRSYLNFIEEYTGQKITQDEWHKIRDLANPDGSSKAKAEDNWRIVGIAVFDGTPVDFPITKAYPSEWVAELAADEGYMRPDVIDEPTAAAVLEQLAQDTDRDVRVAIAHKNIATEEALQRLSNETNTSRAELMKIMSDGDWLVDNLSNLTSTSAQGDENSYLDDVQVRKMNDAEYVAALLDSSILREHLDNEWVPNGDELSRRYVDLMNNVKENPPTQGTVNAIEYLAKNGIKETLEKVRERETSTEDKKPKNEFDPFDPSHGAPLDGEDRS